MQYEEYKKLMAAQKREACGVDAYTAIVEPAYMALGDVDKEMFCKLPDKVVDAVSKLVRKVEAAYAALDEKDKAYATLAKQAEELGARLEVERRDGERQAEEMAGLEGELEKTRRNAARITKILKVAVADKSTDEIVGFALSAMLE